MKKIILALAIMVFASPVEAKPPLVWNKCKACHTYKNGGKNKIGPNLFGVVGRQAASVKNYKYSKTMQGSAIIWRPEVLDSFLKRPKKFLKGTKMSFRGIKNNKQRTNLIEFLKGLK